MGLVMVVVALLVLVFSIGYGVNCDRHVDGHGIGQTLATEFFLHVTVTSLSLGFILRTSVSNSHTHREAHTICTLRILLVIHGRAVSVCTNNPEIGRMGRGWGVGV